jgi:hypothetical protein
MEALQTALACAMLMLETRMLMPAATAKQREIEKKVHALAERLRPDVVNIKYDIAQDWSGDWAIFFRILLSDEASTTRLRDVTNNVVSRMSETLDFPALGVFPYFDFRSAAEQAVLQEEIWV